VAVDGDGAHLLFGGGALEDGNLGSGCELIKMFGFASGRDVKVGLVAEHAWSLHWIIFIVGGELLETVVGFLIDEVSLLDPALDTGRGADARETLFVLEDIDAVAVFYGADAVIDGGNLVAQYRLRRRDVSMFEHTMAPAASREREERQRNCRQEKVKAR
jgi:hypothetical protein